MQLMEVKIHAEIKFITLISNKNKLNGTLLKTFYHLLRKLANTFKREKRFQDQFSCNHVRVICEEGLVQLFEK